MSIRGDDDDNRVRQVEVLAANERQEVEDTTPKSVEVGQEGSYNAMKLEYQHQLQLLEEMRLQNQESIQKQRGS